MINLYTPSRSLNALMAEAGRHAVPTPAEEAALVKASRRGDTRATHNLVLGHLRLVLKLAHNLGRNNGLVEELTAAGISGMMEALESFKPRASKGGRFICYAVFYIRRQMRRTLNDFRTPVTANPNNYDIARKIFAYEDSVLRTESRKASHVEVGKKFGLTPNRVERMKKLLESPMYLDHAIGGEDERSGHDVCADKMALSPSAMTENHMEAEMLQAVMRQHLTEREVAVLEKRFGIGSGTEADLQAIGSAFDLSRERVRQIEVAALKKLKFHLSQLCPVYRARASISGNHPALMPSRLHAHAERTEAPVQVVKAIAHNPVAKIVKLSIAKRSRLVAVAA